MSRAGGEATTATTAAPKEPQLRRLLAQWLEGRFGADANEVLRQRSRDAEGAEDTSSSTTSAVSDSELDLDATVRGFTRELVACVRAERSDGTRLSEFEMQARLERWMRTRLQLMADAFRESGPEARVADGRMFAAHNDAFDD